MEQVRALIRRVGGHVSSVNYRYLELAVEMERRKKLLQGGLASQATKLYQAVSEQARIRTDRISRGVARATTDMWEYGTVAELERLTRRRFVEKPFPNELILYLAAYLEEEKTVGRSRRDRRAGPEDSVRKRATP